jgi:hypothetical protein
VCRHEQFIVAVTHSADDDTLHSRQVCDGFYGPMQNKIKAEYKGLTAHHNMLSMNLIQVCSPLCLFTEFTFFFGFSTVVFYYLPMIVSNCSAAHALHSHIHFTCSLVSLSYAGYIQPRVRHRV